MREAAGWEKPKPTFAQDEPAEVIVKARRQERGSSNLYAPLPKSSAPHHRVAGGSTLLQLACDLRQEFFQSFDPVVTVERDHKLPMLAV